ncbi:ATP-binding protein [Escherichia coli]
MEDSGCGIDPAKLAEIFQPFVQVSGKRGGTGLGLTISSRLAQVMGRRTERHQHAGGWKLFLFTLAVTCCHGTRAKNSQSGGAS